MSSKANYTPLRWVSKFSKEDVDVDDDADSRLLDGEHPQLPSHRPIWRRHLPWIIHGVIIISYIIILPYLFAFFGRPPQNCANKTHSYCELPQPH